MTDFDQKKYISKIDEYYKQFKEYAKKEPEHYALYQQINRLYDMISEYSVFSDDVNDKNLREECLSVCVSLKEALVDVMKVLLDPFCLDKKINDRYDELIQITKYIPQDTKLYKLEKREMQIIIININRTISDLRAEIEYIIISIAHKKDNEKMMCGLKTQKHFLYLYSVSMFAMLGWSFCRALEMTNHPIGLFLGGLTGYIIPCSIEYYIGS